MNDPSGVLVRARALTGFVELVEAHGGGARELLAGAGIDSAILGTPEAALPLDRVAVVLDDAARSLAMPDFGLRLAARQDVSVMGAVGLIARSAANVGEALRGVSRNMRYHTPGARLTMIGDERPGYTQMRYDMLLGPGIPRRQAVELSYAVALGFLRLVTGADTSDWVVGFRHVEGLSPARYRKALGCRVLLGQDVDKLVFPTRLLAAQIDSGSVELQRAAERFVSSVMRRYPLDIAQQVEALIRRQLAAGGCSIELVAKQMRLHKRTLQRRLEEQRLYFEDMIDRLRRERAAELLPHAAIPLSQVGELLGYSEQSSFNRACRRWFGRTPMSVRRQMQRSGRPAMVPSRPRAGRAVRRASRAR